MFLCCGVQPAVWKQEWVQFFSVVFSIHPAPPCSANLLFQYPFFSFLPSGSCHHQKKFFKTSRSIHPGALPRAFISALNHGIYSHPKTWGRSSGVRGLWGQLTPGEKSEVTAELTVFLAKMVSSPGVCFLIKTGKMLPFLSPSQD